ncbi:MAG: hypothetical protein JNK60_12085 [Acidobacteria bacterium]|nr:hypothetical protein [Acidobacteriota bacterium]
MSFLSRDFQAYGAGERLAARFGSSHSMAASKPRKVPRENDTAYWNPAVVTNEDGLATVFFRLPANQTTWHVTAVAVDGRGRFGEGGADFSTNAPVTVALVTPPFLRAGDHAEARLVVGNREARAKHVSAVVVPPSGAVLAEPLELNERLEPKRDGVARVPFTVPAGAASAPSSSWEVRLQVDEGVPSSLPFVFRALPSNTSRVHSRVLTAGEAFDATTHPAPETGGPPESLGEVSSVRIFATSRLAGTLLPSLAWLSKYPWGCVEQVTSASVPGLVLRDVLGKDVELANEDDTVREEVRRSLESSSTGLARLRSLRNSDGSYVWWPGSGRGDADMTAYVLSLLATFDDPELLRGLEARRSAGWLRGKTPSLGSSRGVLLTYVEARLVALGLAPKDGTSAETALAFQAGWALAHGSFRDRAYVLLALKARGLEATPAFRLVTKDLLRSLAPAAQADPALLGGEGPGALAVAAHALAAYGRIEGDPSDFTLRLLGSFGGEHYGSTFETSQVLAHSRWLLQREIEGGARPPELRVLQNGREVPSEHVVRRTGLFGTEVKVAGAIARRGPIVVESDDRRASLRAVIESSAPYDERNGEAASVRVSGENGVSLSRSYHRLDAKTGQLTPLRGPVAVGDLVYVRLSFARPVPRSYAAATYYDLSDDVPAGFTVVAEDRMYDAAPFGLGLREARFVAREIRPERVRWVFAFNHAFMDEPAQTGYVMRAQHAGDFVSGVARLEDFYDETTRLQTPSTRLRIAAPSSRRRGR